MITGERNETRRRWALDRGAAAFLYKPFNATDIDRELHALFGLRMPQLASVEPLKTRARAPERAEHDRSSCSGRRLNVRARDPEEILGLEARAADQRAVDIRDRHQLVGVATASPSRHRGCGCRLPAAPNRAVSRSRMKPCTSATSAGVGVSPVPIAQTGS